MPSIRLRFLVAVDGFESLFNQKKSVNKLMLFGVEKEKPKDEYLPRVTTSRKMRADKKTVMTRDKGVDIAMNTGPLFSTTHVWR